MCHTDEKQRLLETSTIVKLVKMKKPLHFREATAGPVVHKKILLLQNRQKIMTQNIIMWDKNRWLLYVDIKENPTGEEREG